MPQGHQGQAAEPTKSAMDQGADRWSARVPAWLVGRLRLGGGHASTVRPDPSTLAWWEYEAPLYERRLSERLKPPESVSA
jgi:hypothetical protein